MRQHHRSGERDESAHERSYDVAGGLQPRRVWRRVLILATITGLFMSATLWKGEKDSCIRNAGVRSGFNETVSVQGRFLETAQHRAWQAAKAAPAGSKERREAVDAVQQYAVLIAAQRPVHVLDCSGLLPDNQ